MRITVSYQAGGGATIFVREALSNASMGELRRTIDRVRREGHVPTVNLAELTLADRVSLQYLAAIRKDGVALQECPSYVDVWINRTLDAPQHSVGHATHP